MWSRGSTLPRESGSQPWAQGSRRLPRDRDPLARVTDRGCSAGVIRCELLVHALWFSRRLGHRPAESGGFYSTRGLQVRVSRGIRESARPCSDSWTVTWLAPPTPSRARVTSKTPASWPLFGGHREKLNLVQPSTLFLLSSLDMRTTLSRPYLAYYPALWSQYDLKECFLFVSPDSTTDSFDTARPVQFENIGERESYDTKLPVDIRGELHKVRLGDIALGHSLGCKPEFWPTCSYTGRVGVAARVHVSC